MKRLFLALVAALAVVAFAAGSGTAGDAKGPPCTNFIFGDAGYTYISTNDSGTVQATMTLAAPACAESTFLLDIYDFSGTTLLVDNVTGTAVGETVTFSYSFAPGTAPDNGVCLVAESYFRGRLADRAPNQGCLVVPANESPGGGGFD